MIYLGGLIVIATVIRDLIRNTTPRHSYALFALGNALVAAASIPNRPLSACLCTAVAAWSAYRWWNHPKPAANTDR
ncbi:MULTISPECIES: hypothetical protein [Streptomyces]|uniref:hypothetical protein n=1 Tax=Streptomyces TaxID=1883 RepID=UPI00345C560B